MKRTTLQINFKNLCEEKNIDMTYVAGQIGVSLSSLSRSLAGDPKLSTLRKIADCLGVSIQTLVEDDKEVEGWLMMEGKIHRIHSHKELVELCNNKEKKTLTKLKI